MNGTPKMSPDWPMLEMRLAHTFFLNFLGTPFFIQEYIAQIFVVGVATAVGHIGPVFDILGVVRIFAAQLPRCMLAEHV